MREAPSIHTDLPEDTGGGVDSSNRKENVFGTEGKATDFFVAESYRPFQRETLEEIEQAYEQGFRHVLVDAPTGSGKSHIARALAFQSGDAHIITVQKLLQDQYQRDFSKMYVMKGRNAYTCLRGEFGATCADGPCRLKKQESCPSCPYKLAKMAAMDAAVTVHNFDSFYYQNSFGHGFTGRKLLIVDECFVGSTLVMGEFCERPIKDVRVGERVWSYNEKTRGFELNRVVRKITKPTDKVYQVSLVTGESIVCTGNHKFLTPLGWVCAEDLKHGVDLMRPAIYTTSYGKERTETKSKVSVSLLRSYMHILWRFFRMHFGGENLGLPSTWCDLLFPGVRSFCKIGVVTGEGENRVFQTVGVRANEEKQSDEESGDSSEGIHNASEHGMAPTRWRGKRSRLVRGAKSISRLLGMGRGSGSCHRKRSSGEVQLSDPLQGGYRPSRGYGGYRGRRALSRCFGTAREGREEGSRIERVGVKSITVYERGSHGRFENVSEGGAVFDLEVENNHTYIVSGVVVHNCHNIPNKFSSFLSFTITSRGGIEVPEGETLRDYDLFVKQAYAEYSDELERYRVQYEVDGLRKDTLKRMQDLSRLVHRMSRYIQEREKDHPEEYVFDYSNEGQYAPKVTFRPVYVGDYSSRWLFNYGERTLMMSATILDKEMFCKEVGLDPEWVYYIRVPSSFPAENRPIIKKYAGKMNYREIKSTLPTIVEYVQEIADRYPGRKGIVQTHSEKIANYLREYLDDPRFTYNKDYSSPQQMLDVHESKPGSIIIASGLREGLDLRGELSKIQVFCKIPYPSLGDKVVARKLELDEAWYGWMTSLMFVQALGRSVRSSKEKAVTYILDSGFGWFYKRNKRFIPKYIKDAIKW